jgi:hypothetical protein
MPIRTDFIMANIGIAIRHFITNMICGLIYNQETRKRVRAKLNSPFLGLLLFIKKDCGEKHFRYKTLIGFRAQNILIMANNKYIYKYPAKKIGFAKNIEVRERDITKELSKVSPVYIPIPTLLKYEKKWLRRYDVVKGLSLRQLIKKGKLYEEHKYYLAHQVANFLYVIAKYNPESLKKYKDNPDDKPAFMYGWHHCDLWDNFMIDPKTFEITSFIDWEEVAFGDFKHIFRDKNPKINEFAKIIESEYKKIYEKGI